MLVRRDGIDPALAAWSAGGRRGSRRPGPPAGPRRGRPGWPARRCSTSRCRWSRWPPASTPPTTWSARPRRRRTTTVAEARRRRDRGGQGQPRRRRAGAGGRRGQPGCAGQLKELEKRQKSRATRLGRDSLDRALVDLAGAVPGRAGARAARRPESRLPLAHPDRRADAAGAGPPDRSRGGAAADRRRAGLPRTALEQNVKPQIAVEALTVALRLPA